MQGVVISALIAKPQEDADLGCSANSDFEELSDEELEMLLGTGGILLRWDSDWDDFFRDNPQELLTRVAPLAEWEQGRGRYGGRFIKP